MLIGQLDGFAMTTRQLFSFSVCSVAMDRANGVDDVPDVQPAAASDDGFSRRQTSNSAHDLPALSEYRRAACAVNRAIDSASAQKR
jgi:hypothetical protein